MKKSILLIAISLLLAGCSKSEPVQFKPMYFEYGIPTENSTTNWTTLEKDVFIADDSSHRSRGLCITPIINGNKKLECFEFDMEDVEINHLNSVAKKVNGDNSSTCSFGESCHFGDYTCSIAATGGVKCQSKDSSCHLYSNSGVICE